MRKLLHGRRPTPSLVISMIALFAALGGSAFAALRITSANIVNHTIRGVDIANGTISSAKLAPAARSALAAPGASAQEAVRKAGPENQPAGAHTVATLSGLQPGTYLLLAKSTMTTALTDQGILGEVLKANKTIAGHCVLDAAGDQDDARAPIATPYTETPSTMNMQMTRTIDAPIDVSVVCDSDYAWRASDTSIVALKLASSSRTDVTG